jgi:hypothetical protein
MIEWLDYFPRRPRKWWNFRPRTYVVLSLCSVLAVALGLIYNAVWPRPLYISKTERTRSELAMLSTPMDGYAVDHGTYPAQLGDLVKEFPGMGAAGTGFGVDWWGQPLVYSVSADGQHAVIYSCGPSGIDRHGAGDNIAMHYDYVPPTTTTAPSTQPP